MKTERVSLISSDGTRQAINKQWLFALEQGDGVYQNHLREKIWGAMTKLFCGMVLDGGFLKKRIDLPLPEDELQALMLEVLHREKQRQRLGGDYLFKAFLAKFEYLVMPILEVQNGTITGLELGTGHAEAARKVVEFGRGNGHEYRVTAIDLQSAFVKLSRKRLEQYPEVEVLEADAGWLPFPDGHFDVVFATCFLHHFFNSDRKFADLGQVVSILNEAHRVTRKGGAIVIMDIARSLINPFVFWAGTLGYPFGPKHNALSVAVKTIPPEDMDWAIQQSLAAPYLHVQTVDAGIKAPVLLVSGVKTID